MSLPVSLKFCNGNLSVIPFFWGGGEKDGLGVLSSPLGCPQKPTISIGPRMHSELSVGCLFHPVASSFYCQFCNENFCFLSLGGGGVRGLKWPRKPKDLGCPEMRSGLSVGCFFTLRQLCFTANFSMETSLIFFGKRGVRTPLTPLNPSLVFHMLTPEVCSSQHLSAEESLS